MTPRSWSLRARLTLWYTAALAVLLLPLGGLAMFFLDRGLHDAVDASLISVARAVAETSHEQSGAALADRLEGLLGPTMGRRFFQLLDPYGRPDPRVAPPHDQLGLSEQALHNAQRGQETFETLPLLKPNGGELRLLTYPVVERGRMVNVVQVAMPLDTVDAALRRFLLILLGLAPVAVSGAAAGGWFVAGRALKPVGDMVATAQRISAEDLSLRLQNEPRNDELGRLSAVLNDMLRRLERSFTTARAFSADAAHELRTPLTILKGELETTLRSLPPNSDNRHALESCLEEVDRLATLVEDLLFLARADANALDIERERLDLSILLHDVEPGLQALAGEAHTTLHIDAWNSVWVLGNASMLFRVFFNLGENAIKYAGNEGYVEILLKCED
ncbi:MAG TPA: histidine kinase dimerization/phospho-acceptor domain-containing protein, partial [Candidatus Acidoferrales bacterium]|nr:histidine kinase dimerization/phospho-acceptor domain-containing protein [Candidatus Acidoferrales bacterium]